MRNPYDHWSKGTWKNGKKTVTGIWLYNWSADTFSIILDSKDSITGQQRSFTTCNDTPEWGNWKLVRKETE